MNKREAADSVRKWLLSEKLEARDVEDQQAHLHMHAKYPPSKRGHLFNVVIPRIEISYWYILSLELMRDSKIR